jgi:hypothetical protein
MAGTTTIEKTFGVSRQTSRRSVGVHPSVLRSKPAENGKARRLHRLRKSCPHDVQERIHLSVEDLMQIAGIAETMNRRKPSQLVESSEAIRQPSHLDG